MQSLAFVHLGNLMILINDITVMLTVPQDAVEVVQTI